MLPPTKDAHTNNKNHIYDQYILHVTVYLPTYIVRNIEKNKYLLLNNKLLTS